MDRQAADQVVYIQPAAKDVMFVARNTDDREAAVGFTHNACNKHFRCVVEGTWTNC
jgi:hypothetical protein